VDHGVCLRCETLTLIKVAAALHWERELLNLIGFRCGRLQIPREAPFPNEVLLRLFKGVHCTLLSRVQPGSIYRGEWAVYTRLLLVGVRQRSLGERGGQAGTHGYLGCVDCGLNEIMLQVPGYRIL
jgi:hypothetical protein